MTKFVYGIAGYASWALYLPGKVIPRLDAFPIHPEPPLYNAIPLYEHCVVVGGKDKRPTFSINDNMRFPMSPSALSSDDYINAQSPDPGIDEYSKLPPTQQRVTRPLPPARHPAPMKGQSPSAIVDDQTIPAWSARLSEDNR